MLAAAMEYFGPCTYPMWPFQHWRCSKHEETYEGERFPRRLGSVKGLEVRGISARLRPKKSLPFPIPRTSSLSHFHPPFWLRAPSQHLFSFSRFTPPPSTLLPLPPSRLCHLDPSSCTAEICGRVAAVELCLLVTMGSGAAS